MNISHLATNKRLIKAMIGITYEEFTELCDKFEKVYIEYKLNNKNRKRALGGGQKGHLPTMDAKLLFILFYIKTYPTMDVLGFFFGKSSGRSTEAVHLFMTILKKALGREIVLPERKIRSVEEFLEKFPEVKDILLDGTERKIQRPKYKKSQKRNYSGKKKTHTRKNLVVVDENKRILALSATRMGRTHDKRILNEMTLNLPDNIGKFGDTAFIGMDKMYANTVVPKKRNRNNPLTEKDKENNRIISSIRVVVEHALAGIKKFRAVSDRFRNRLGRFDDDLMLVVCGLHNYHIKRHSA